MLVKFIGTADRSDRTGALSGLGDGRPDILRGGEGELTEEEIASLSARGIVLEVVDLDKESKGDLEARAEALDIDTSGLKSKEALVKAIHGRLETTSVPPEPGPQPAPGAAPSTGATT